MISSVFLYTDAHLQEDPAFDELTHYIRTHYNIEVQIKCCMDTIPKQDETTLLLLYTSDQKIKSFLKAHKQTGVRMAILPTSENPRSKASYGVSSNLHEALEDAFNEARHSDVDLLMCNGEPAFTNIVIGDVHGLNNTALENQTLFNKVTDFFTHIKHLSFKDYTLVTAKGHKIETASTGIMVLEHNVKKGHYNLINEEFSLHDGKLNAFILSPTNLIAYLYYLFLVLFLSRFSLSSLPKSIGMIKTSRLCITSSKAIDFKVDGIMMSAKELDLEILPDSVRMALGRNISTIPETTSSTEEEKDTIKTQSLPKGEMKLALITESVPLFKKANEEDFKELFLSLKDNAKLNSIFLVLMVLSTLLATTGLFQNSAPVIIGAMILAPLMAPIVSLSMGVVRGERQLMTNSARTLFYGILTALFFSCVYTYMMPLSELTPEMRGRLNPNILDLMVAVISGIAGAYANAKSEVAKSLAGVAIAVALVPPLSVTGIGIGWGSLSVIYGSFLLFTTNLIGITLSAAITFVILGYAPIHSAKKGLAYTLVLLGVITIPLFLSFKSLIIQNKILSQLGHKTYVLHGKPIILDVHEVDLSQESPVLYVQSTSEHLLESQDLHLLNHYIAEELQKEVILNITMKTVVKGFKTSP